MNNRSLFIATPISAFPTDNEYVQFRDWITKLSHKIVESKVFDNVFCVACNVKSQQSLDDPVDSLKGDITELDMASHFLFIYPIETPTSALIELGYALAKNKNIIIAHPKNISLPFMARKMDKVFNKVDILDFDEFNDRSLLDVLFALELK